MKTNGTPQNPAHPDALTLADVHYNIWFTLHNANGDPKFTARFIEAPHWSGGDVLLSNQRGADFRMTLYDLGISPNEKSEWNEVYCLRHKN